MPNKNSLLFINLMNATDYACRDATWWNSINGCCRRIMNSWPLNGSKQVTPHSCDWYSMLAGSCRLHWLYYVWRFYQFDTEISNTSSFLCILFSVYVQRCQRLRFAPMGMESLTKYTISVSLSVSWFGFHTVESTLSKGQTLRLGTNINGTKISGLPRHSWSCCRLHGSFARREETKDPQRWKDYWKDRVQMVSNFKVREKDVSGLWSERVHASLLPGD